MKKLARIFGSIALAAVLVFAIAGCEFTPPGDIYYVVTKSGVNYSAVKGEDFAHATTPVGAASTTLQTVINNIRTDAVGESSVYIQLGNGTDTLDIGSTYINFSANWGTIYLSGKVTSSQTSSSWGAITFSTGVSAVSTADITCTGSGGNAIQKEGAGTLTINSGTITAPTGLSRGVNVYNAGATVIINGGTISGGTSGRAVSNSGKLTINGGTMTGNYWVVYNATSTGTANSLTINGGTMTGSGSSTPAVYNYYNAQIIINGGTISSSVTGSWGTVHLSNAVAPPAAYANVLTIADTATINNTAGGRKVYRADPNQTISSNWDYAADNFVGALASTGTLRILNNDASYNIVLVEIKTPNSTGTVVANTFGTITHGTAKTMDLDPGTYWVQVTDNYSTPIVDDLSSVVITADTTTSIMFTGTTLISYLGVASVSISPDTPQTVNVGATLSTLSATVNKATADTVTPSQTVTWSVSGGGTYASVNATTGAVTGLAAGTATIRATSTQDPTKFASKTVTVSNPAAQLTINWTGPLVSLSNPKVTITPASPAINNVALSSGDTKTGLTAGTATVVITGDAVGSNYGGFRMEREMTLTAGANTLSFSIGTVKIKNTATSSDITKVSIYKDNLSGYAAYDALTNIEKDTTFGVTPNTWEFDLETGTFYTVILETTSGLGAGDANKTFTISASTTTTLNWNGATLEIE